MSLTSIQLSAQIDTLFEQYLGLLHQHDSLRKRLGISQASTLQNIARANFSAPRGTRYGQDLYDTRITATRLLSINSSSSSDTPPLSFVISPSPLSAAPPSSTTTSASTPTQGDAYDSEPKEKVDEEGAKAERKAKIKDPIHMFGILAIPSSLRLAQKEAIDMLDVVTEIVTVDMQMREVEIQIRRARKFRVKAESAEKAMVNGEVEKEAVGVN